MTDSISVTSLDFDDISDAVLAVDPERYEAARREALALLDGIDGLGDALPEGMDSTGLIFHWMVSTLLGQPTFFTQLLERLHHQGIPTSDFDRSAHRLRWNEHAQARRVCDGLAQRDPRDQAGNEKWLREALGTCGILESVARVVATVIAALYVLPFPFGMILAIVAAIFGFIVILATAAILVVLAALRDLLGQGRLAAWGPEPSAPDDF